MVKAKEARIKAKLKASILSAYCRLLNNVRRV